jgi:hypothetical protein
MSLIASEVFFKASVTEDKPWIVGADNSSFPC